VFVATALLYPCALGALCVGAGLVVDRASGRFLSLSLLVALGAAALIGLSQLSTYIVPLAPATPYLMLALALAGPVLGFARLRELLGACARNPWPAGISVLAYVLALAPVLLSGRPSFSSYMALADSAVHLMGADYLIRHGQDYAHLDLRNSYGLFVHWYYGSSYPSGADTLFGGSAALLGLPLIWAFQPFNAFVLTSAAGPSWLLAGHLGLRRGWAAAAVMCMVLPALVYAYELIASVKEITALSMLLTLGALSVEHRRWLGGPARRAIPFALALAAGASALGPAFGAWGLAAVAALATTIVAGWRGGRSSRRDGYARRVLASVCVAALALLLAALPTWTDIEGALRVAQAIATTSNPGNLHEPLRLIQVFGVWLGGSYKLPPKGGALTATHALIALAFALALIGALRLIRTRALALAGWLFLTLLASFVISQAVSTWADAKTLVLSSPLVVLLVWAGVAALTSSRRIAPVRLAGVLAALALTGGVLASDALLYHSSDLAPTARYEELASLNTRFAGRGPTLFTDFDEYALYELRDLDVGGPDFAYPPPELAAAAGGHGQPVRLDRVEPRALLAYPLILTRRDPSQSRPPAAYRLAWQGAYYQVWARRRGAPAAVRHVALSGTAAQQCSSIAAIAVHATSGEELVAAQAPELVPVALARARRPRRWGRERAGLVMSTPGRLTTSFALPRGGRWQVWVQGQIMPAVTLSIDGRRVESIAGQLDGNSLVPDTVPPVTVALSAGSHRLSVERSGFSLAPGQAGAAVLDGIFLTPADGDPEGPLRTAAPADWANLCGPLYQWLELVPSIAGGP
jgi:hypothetical protein